MKQVPRIISNLNILRSTRVQELNGIFSLISARRNNINIIQRSIQRSLVYGISDGVENGSNFKSWRFKTLAPGISANYLEVWNSLELNRYFLERSYLHVFLEENFKEIEYIFLHSDASEPDNTEHSLYKQSIHLHVEVARSPIPKAHIALYNGRHTELLSSLTSFNKALKESIIMIDSQILQRI